MSGKKCFAACILTALFIFVTFSSMIFIVLESEHDCTGEDCSVCYHIGVCENTLKFGLVAAVLTAVPDGASFF